MSYDISLVIETGAGNWVEAVEIGNYTSNVSGMWAKALGGQRLRELDNVSAGSAAAKLSAAVKAMEKDPGEYRKMNPENGWGDYEGALEYLRSLANACEQHPACVIRVHS
jgi:hypothetical protein